MAKKKTEIALMQEIETQEEWEDIMSKEGMWVVDVYQEWSGPCDAMVSNFRRIKNELGDDLLHFAKAKCDGIESLEKYRGSCEPCFLFYAAGVLVSFVHGANAPLIIRTLTEQLSQEHKVIDGTAERKEVKDAFIGSKEIPEVGEDEEEEEPEDGQTFQYNGEVIMYGDDLTPAADSEEVEQGYTVAIIKPNVVADGQVDDILAEMKAKGIEVIAQEERHLTEDEAKEFYAHLKDEEYFNDLVSFMTSGPSHVLVLTKGAEDDSIIKDWREMLGPPTVEDAKEQEPESLRAKYGQAGLMNALHGSDSKETAARELAFFFPHMNAPTMQRKKKELQRTLALIRPDAFASNRDAILERIKESGFQIALQKQVELTREQAAEFYKEHEGQEYFEELVTRMSSGPLLALGLARDDAVSNWREMLGPTDVEEAKETAPDSLRAQFAVPEVQINPLHGSDTVENAKKELDFFFPMEQTVAMIKPDAMGTKEAIIEKIHQAGFRIAARKETNISREIAESFYEDQKDKEYFNDLVEHMTSGPTLFMVLSKEGAVEGWREQIGPTDPETAKELAPDSLRAQFGSDVLKNAVHGASNREEAQKKIQAMFGDIEFNPDGTVKGDEPQTEEQQKAVSGSPVPQAADVAPEYKEQGQAEGEGQSEEKPAEGETAEKKEVEEEKPSEKAAESADKDDSAEKADDKPTEQAAESADKDKDEKDKDKDDKDKDEKVKDDKDQDDKVKDDKVKDDKDEGEKVKDDKDEGEKVKDDKDQDDKDKEEKAKDDKDKDSGQAAEINASSNAQVAEQKEEAKAEQQKEEAKEETKADEQKEETKADEQKEETKAEEQKAEQKEEEGKAEKKEEAAEAKKEGEEGKAAD